MKSIFRSCTFLGAAALMAMAVPAFAQSTGSSQTGQTGQSGQSGSSGQTGQSGQSGSYGQSGHTGQRGSSYNQSGQGGQRSTAGRNAMTQAQLDQQKTALKDRVNKALDTSKADIDKIQAMDQQATGARKTHYDTLLKQVNDRKDKLQADLGTVDTATTTDWTRVKTQVNNDLARFNYSARVVAQATRTANNRRGGTTGVTNRQGTGSSGTQGTQHHQGSSSSQGSQGNKGSQGNTSGQTHHGSQSNPSGTSTATPTQP